MQAVRWLAVALLVAASLAGSVLAQDEPEPAIRLDDQSTSGRILIVDAFRLPEPGFVVIREPSAQAPAQGKVLGYSNLYGGGLHQTVPVNLFSNVTEQQMVVATLHEDANGNNVYDGVNHTGHDHRHSEDDVGEGADPAFRSNGTPIADIASVEPYGLDSQSPKKAPMAGALWTGSVAALAGLALWAVRYRGA